MLVDNQTARISKVINVEDWIQAVALDKIIREREDQNNKVFLSFDAVISTSKDGIHGLSICGLEEPLTYDFYCQN